MGVQHYFKVGLLISQTPLAEIFLCGASASVPNVNLLVRLVSEVRRGFQNKSGELLTSSISFGDMEGIFLVLGVRFFPLLCLLAVQ